eukprot:TRINITY_DN3971_c0_g1_i2.p1 TRINITY_DN3971_c0_g1~~TRINITY_DN3971_c0_g1_i2.p1  ORF type:complete len:543 (+),score=108.12 TRINITY_DN3971_c0_g1_i2:25-1629(+)
MEEETKESKTNKKCNFKTRNGRGKPIPHHSSTLTDFSNHHQNSFRSFRNGFCYQNQYSAYPALLPLPSPPPLQLPPLLQNHFIRNNTHFNKVPWKHKPSRPASSDNTHVPVSTLPQVPERFQQKTSTPRREDNKHSPSVPLDHCENPTSNSQALVAIRRPDSGGVDGHVIPLLANHFLVQFNPSLRIFHYDVEIAPHPSKEVARMIKRKLVQDNPSVVGGSLPAFDGRRNLYSPIEFLNDDKLELFISLPIPTAKTMPLGDDDGARTEKLKLFKVNIKLVSKLEGKDLSKYLSKEDDYIPLPQDYLHALDVVLRESPTEKCIPVGRSLYSSSMGGIKDIGGGAVGLRGFFQSLRPTQQGLALNVDFSVTAFHESIGIIPYLQKRCDFLRDLSQRKTRGLVGEEKKEVERALKNIRVFVCHRDTDQRYRVFSLTDEATENLRFRDRGGKDLRLVDYFKEHYNHDIQFRNLPCLQISRSKPCYLPMELCVVCEGQKFLGKLSDDQTAKILKMGCQRPRERKAIINGVMDGVVGPTR